MQSASALTERDPSALGPYVLLGRVADGGMGVVYLGRHDGRADSLVAVKTLKPHVPADSMFRSRLRHEIQAARALSELGAFGSSIARLVDADETRDRPWLAWEYIPGPSLHGRAGAKPLSPSEVRGVARELAAAIAQLHAVGYAHCDVKPANIVLGPDGLRLVDLGLVHDVREPALVLAMGSPGWSPPEQSSPDRDGRGADVHGWGMCVAFAATGGNPFGTGRPSVVRREMLSGRPELGMLDDALRPLVVAALAADPRLRPTMADVVTRLAAIEMPPSDAIAAGTSARATTASPSPTQAVSSPTLIDGTTPASTPHAVLSTRGRVAPVAVAAAVVLLLLASSWVSRPSASPASGRSSAAATSPSPSPSVARPLQIAVVVPVTAKVTPSRVATPPVHAKANAKPHGKGKGRGKMHR